MYRSGSSGVVNGVERQVVEEALSAQRRRSGALCRLAESGRERARQDRARSRRVRQETIRLVWRSRQLRYDRHGPIVAMWDGDREAAGEAFGPDSVVNGLFELGVILSALHRTVDGDHRDQVGAAIDRLDRLIGDIRVAALARQRDLHETPEGEATGPTATTTR